MSSHIARMRHLNQLWQKGFIPSLQEAYTAIGKKQDKQTVAVMTIQVDDWKTDETGETSYSFEKTYPADQFDLSVEPDGENLTDAQMAAWLVAKPVGSAMHNRIILMGNPPEIGIPVMIKVVKKVMALSIVNMGGGTGDGGMYPVSIEVTAPPAKTEYHPGDTLDLTGMVVKAIYNDGSRALITSQCTMEPANGAVLTKSNTEIRIAWVWETLGNTYQTVQPIAMQVPYRIRFKTVPTKTSYKAGEKLDTAGMMIVADYMDGGEVDVTSAAVLTPANGAAIYESTTALKASWTDPDTEDTFEVTTPVTVTRVLSSITVSAPTKNSYKEDETLNLSGAAVTAHYNSGATANVTSKATFTPANGTKLTKSGTTTITASYTENGVTKTATTSVTVKPALEIVTWANGTEEQLAAMLEAHYAGTINIHNYWKVGDERTVSLSAMAKGAVGETHAAQSQTFVLMNAGGKTLETSVNGKTECAFIVGQKNCLANGTTIEAGYMNSTDTNYGGWGNCKRRTWCNATYAAALPTKFRALFKKFKNVTASDSGPAKATSIDEFAFASEKEIFGSTKYANSSAESGNKQFEYYKTSANRIKKRGNSGSAYAWWERSPYTGYSNYFCSVLTDGGPVYGGASRTAGLAPFGCI